MNFQFALEPLLIVFCKSLHFAFLCQDLSESQPFIADQFLGPRRNQWPSNAFCCCYFVSTNPFLPAGIVANCTNGSFLQTTQEWHQCTEAAFWLWMSERFDTKLSSWCFMAFSCLKTLCWCGFSHLTQWDQWSGHSLLTSQVHAELNFPQAWLMWLFCGVLVILVLLTVCCDSLSEHPPQ